MSKITIFAAICFLVVSCSTYTITPEQFKEQFTAAGTGMDTVRVNNPLFPSNKITYRANRLQTITVLDKQGLITYLDNSPSLEMRVTQKNGKKRTMYFDTVELRNDTLYGNGSRLIGAARQIPFDSIVKIEIQEGGKKFSYQD